MIVKIKQEEPSPVTRFYFDHNATTPVSSEVLQAYTEALRDVYGNASSIHHFGQAAKLELDTARRQTASLLNCGAREIVFTSGGTEADNLAIFGAVRASSKPRKHVVTTVIEHPAVLNACVQLEREGVAVSYVNVDRRGFVDPDYIECVLRPETVLVSIMHANNETGVIQPVARIAALARERGILMHSDGVQAAGKMRVDVKALGVDLYSISGHKLYAPKGAGALYVRKGVELAPVMYGGRHEDGRRAGTENVPAVVALSVAMGATATRFAEESARLGELRDRLETAVLKRVPDTSVNGAGAERIPNTTNIRFDGIGGEAMVIALDLAGFAVSTGAACSSGAVEPSHVLTAMGLDREQARAGIRFSLGRGNTVEQVDALVDAVVDAACRLRRISATYA
jgi:cysteine desulfurase